MIQMLLNYNVFINRIFIINVFKENYKLRKNTIA